MKVNLSQTYRHGGYQLFEISDGDSMQHILNWLQNARSGFRYNTPSLLEAFRESRIYGVQLIETNFLHEKRCSEDRIFQSRQHGQLTRPWRLYMLPAFCVVNYEDPHQCDFLWVHSSVRRQGIARFMVDSLDIMKVNERLAGSETFWDRVLCTNVLF